VDLSQSTPGQYGCNGLDWLDRRSLASSNKLARFGGTVANALMGTLPLCSQFSTLFRIICMLFPAYHHWACSTSTWALVGLKSNCKFLYAYVIIFVGQYARLGIIFHERQFIQHHDLNYRRLLRKIYLDAAISSSIEISPLISNREI
jgi:hypothetical protein